MISYEYKLYQTKKVSHLDKMLGGVAFVWNHALALQKCYYRVFNIHGLQDHFAKQISRYLLHSQATQEILEHLDSAYLRFFKKKSTRQLKFKRTKNFSFFVFGLREGCKLEGHCFRINKIAKTCNFSLSRSHEDKIELISIKQRAFGEYWLILALDTEAQAYGMDDGMQMQTSCFLNKNLPSLKKKSCFQLKSAHASCVNKIEYIAKKYDVVIRKMDKFFPSSKKCTCSYIKNDLSLKEREWTHPEWRIVHQGLLATNSILRQDIAELESGNKTTPYRRAA